MAFQFILAAAVSLVIGGNFLIIGKLIEEFTLDFSKAEIIFKIGSFMCFIIGYLLGHIGLIMILLS